jgi:hypothetical protein
MKYWITTFLIAFLSLSNIYSQDNDLMYLNIQITKSNATTGGFQNDDGIYHRYFEPGGGIISGNVYLSIIYNNNRITNDIECMVLEYGIYQIFFAFHIVTDNHPMTASRRRVFDKGYNYYISRDRNPLKRGGTIYLPFGTDKFEIYKLEGSNEVEVLIYSEEGRDSDRLYMIFDFIWPGNFPMPINWETRKSLFPQIEWWTNSD